MYVVVMLPEWYLPSGDGILKRYGRSADGGYLIDERDIKRSSALLSFGLSDDWSFEAAVWSKRRIPLHVYDGEAGEEFLVQRFSEALRKPFSVGRILRRYKKIRQYQSFFKEPRCHIKKYVRGNAGFDAVEFGDAFKALNLADGEKAFIKIDIEGSEYEILDQLLKYSSSISGLAIEFHDCMERECLIRSFLETFPLPLVHVHPNNAAGLGRFGRPQALELTFSSSSTGEIVPGGPSLPHAEDRPNDKKKPELSLCFDRRTENFAVRKFK